MKKLIMMSALALGLAACAEQEAAEVENVDVVEEPMMDDGAAMANDMGNDMGEDGDDRGNPDDRLIDEADDMGDEGNPDDRI
ncbi:hypothetical protein [Sphingomicrobium flavum]|uniref:hypothetical protein n=1 Tax=Sphingomicrobium flavum TaxID=1229164 RepID=UPI0021AD56CF|nr:hypothetical protein [Sphingomicrobium flavum]